jgi:hypothetical protein
LSVELVDHRRVSSPIRALHLKPDPPLKLGEYDLDAFAVEYTDDGSELDFRLELGLSYDIFWALPAAEHDRLRLAHVDAAVYHVDEPTLLLDPYTCDVAKLRWDGELATLANGSTIVSVFFTAATSPASYRCEIGVRTAHGETLVRVFAWAAG